MNKYNIAASKAIGDMVVYKQLKEGIDYFDLDIWEDEKVAEQMAIDFACRKKEIVKGIYTCNKCGSNQVYTQSIQTRSGDEATDVYALCANSDCRSKPWKVA